MSETGKAADDVDAGDANLPALVARLGEDVLRLIDSKLSLLKIEIQEDVWAYGRNLFFVGVAGIVGAVGFALLNVALAFVVADLLRSTQLSRTMQYAVGFASMGIVYLVAGSAIASRAWARLAKRDPTPEKTRIELEKDMRWLKRESK